MTYGHRINLVSKVAAAMLSLAACAPAWVGAQPAGAPAEVVLRWASAAAALQGEAAGGKVLKLVAPAANAASLGSPAAASTHPSVVVTDGRVPASGMFTSVAPGTVVPLLSVGGELVGPDELQGAASPADDRERLEVDPSSPGLSELMRNPPRGATLHLRWQEGVVPSEDGVHQAALPGETRLRVGDTLPAPTAAADSGPSKDDLVLPYVGGPLPALALNPPPGRRIFLRVPGPAPNAPAR